MVTTFVHLVDNRAQGVRDFLNKASQTDERLRLAELEYPSLKKCWDFVRIGS